MIGVILDADSLGKEVDLSPITSLLDDWHIYGSTSADETAARIEPATVILTNKIHLDQATLAAAGSVSYISVMATGTNNVDLSYTSSRNIIVSNAVAYATPSVVQHTISLILALSTSLPAYLADVRAGAWQESKVFCLLTHPITEVAGKTLGIVGYGELGRNVADAAKGLGMKIMVSNRVGQAAKPGRVDFDQLLHQADYVSLHCPLSPETENMMNRQAFTRMKPGAFLINTARGGLIDSDALLWALSSGTLAGAAVDVLDTEPAAPDESLIAGPANLLVTPHNAWAAIESRQRLVAQMRENIQGFLAGSAMRVVS